MEELRFGSGCTRGMGRDHMYYEINDGDEIDYIEMHNCSYFSLNSIQIRATIEGSLCLHVF